VRRVIARAAGTLLLALAACYLADGVVAKARGAKAYGQVQLRRYYAVPLKNGKTEFMPLDPETDICVHALFPHFGCPPCWSLEGKKERRIDM
jgi:hypothetical protein